MNKDRKLSMGKKAFLSRATESDGLNDIDRSVLEYGADMAAACCNVVGAADEVEVQGVDFFHGVAALSAAAMQAHATLDAAQTLAAAIDRNTAALARLTNCQCLCHVCKPAANDAGLATPGAAPELD